MLTDGELLSLSTESDGVAHPEISNSDMKDTAATARSTTRYRVVRRAGQAEAERTCANERIEDQRRRRVIIVTETAPTVSNPSTVHIVTTDESDDGDDMLPSPVSTPPLGICVI